MFSVEASPNWASEKNRKSSMIGFACLTETTGAALCEMPAPRQIEPLSDQGLLPPLQKKRAEFPAYRRPKLLRRRLCGDPRSQS